MTFQIRIGLATAAGTAFGIWQHNLFAGLWMIYILIALQNVTINANIRDDYKA